MSLEPEIIRILHLEEVAKDIQQVNTILNGSALHCEIKVVKTQVEYKDAIKTFQPDIIIGRSLASFNSIKAMDIIRRIGLKTPFIIIAGPTSEEYAIDALHRGASDYILTDRYLRLPYAIKTAIEKRKAERDLKLKAINEIDYEKRFTSLIQTFPAQIVLLDCKGKITMVNELWKTFANQNGFQNDNYGIGLNYLEVTENACHLDPGVTSIAKSLRALIEGEIDNFSNIYPCNSTHKKMWFRVIGTRNTDNDDPTIVIMHYDISDRMLIEDEHLKINKELTRNKQDFEQFADIVSHNLRSQVANIIGITDALMANNVSLKEEIKLKSYLKTSSHKLDDVIKDLNEILRIKKNINAKKEFVNLSDLIDDIKQSMHPLISQEAVQFELDFSEVDEIYTIKTFLRSILLNLISNSIKYRQTEIRPLIEIKTIKKENSIEIILKDNGIGIDLNKSHNNLFGLYKRIHYHTEGKGLGLFMVKTQLDVLSGNITLKSEINKGTEFRIELLSRIYEQINEIVHQN